jgi:hypothetical protein
MCLSGARNRAALAYAPRPCSGVFWREDSYLSALGVCAPLHPVHHHDSESWLAGG